MKTITMMKVMLKIKIIKNSEKKNIESMGMIIPNNNNYNNNK